MQMVNSAMRTVQQQPLNHTTARWQHACPAVAKVSFIRPVAVAAAAAEDYAPSQAAYDNSGDYQSGDQQQQQYTPRGGRGRGGRGGRGGGRGGYNRNDNDNYKGQRNNYNNDYNNAAGYDGPRGPVSYDEDSGRQGGYNKRGGYGGRGGGRGGGGRGGGGGYGQRRTLSPEAAAVNDALAAATSWRQLNTVLEQQSRSGMPGLDAFQLVEIMVRLTRKDMAIPTDGDDLADFQQFVASVYGWMLERMPTMRAIQVCNAVFAMGRLNLYNAELMDALLASASQQMTSFNAQQYAKFLSGLAALTLTPPADVLEVLLDTQTAQRIVGSAQRDDLGVILSSCQRLGVTPSAEWQDILAQAYLSTIDTPEKAESVRSDFFVKPLVGLAGMGWKPTPEQWQVVLKASEVLLPKGYLRARQLLETAWAMAQFGKPVPGKWAQAFNYQLWGQTQYLYPADIGALLYSMAYIKAKPTPPQLRRMLDNMKARIDQATGDDFANALLALAQFDFTPLNDEFDDMLIELQRTLDTCSAAGLNNIIAALPAMGTGVRLRQVVDAAVARYDAMMAGEAQYAAEEQQPAAEQQPVA